MMRLILQLFVIISVSYTIYSNQTPYEFNNVGLTTSINSVINTDLILTDEYNTNVNLKTLLSNKPTVVNFVYLNCPLLCHLLLDGITDVAKSSPYKLNEDYQIITISIDPNETNENIRAYKKKYLAQMKKQNGWHFLKGSQIQIEDVTKAFGFNYKEIKRTKDFSHPSAIFFYNNKITNYLEGVTFEEKSFNYSLMSGKSNKTIKEKIITYCYYFDPDSQTYTFMIFKILRLLSLITVLILSILIIDLIRKERKLKNHEKH